MTAASILGHAVAAAPWSEGEPDWLLPVIAPFMDESHAARTGVYLATPDAGAAVSTAFWARALCETVALMSPQRFPLTLASSVATGIARAFRLLGPNQTLVGSSDASHAAWDEAEADLAAGVVRRAVVIRFVAGCPRTGSSAHVLVLGDGDGARIPLSPDEGDPIVAACCAYSGLALPHEVIATIRS